jgi:ATP-dependent DNA helicase RecQ
LRQLRDSICDETGLPIYLVASGKTLDELAEFLPQNTDELQKVSGFGKVKAEKFGKRFIELIVAYSEDHGLTSNIKPKPGSGKEKNRRRKRKCPPRFKVLSYIKGAKRSRK